MIYQLAIGFLFVLLPCLQVGGELFEDPEGKYSLTLPSGWSAVVSKDALGRQDVKIVYRVNEHGTLKIRRATVESEMGPKALARREEEHTLRFQPGYAKGSIEDFSGDSALVSYDYTISGRPMMGRNYYVRVNPTTIFVLRFTGQRNTLGPIRNQTDTMARSFRGQ